MSVDDISQLLCAWSDGDQLALDELTPIVYAELRRLAHRYMRRERAGHDLQTSALVNEAYIRLVDYKRMQWQNRAHFFAVSAQLMRRILVERARRHNLKRGGGVPHVSLDEAVLVGVDPGADLVALDDALNALARVDSRKVHRNAIFRRPQHRRDRHGAQGFAGHRETRLEQRQDLAVSRAYG
jgi:RNA polymerase sigma-70 factor (ECF subfamily)